jgi:hypothetical protein
MTSLSTHDPIASAKVPFPCLPIGADFFESAPVRFTNAVELEASPHKLFAILDDEASWPVFAKPGIQKVTWTSPRPHGAGATRTVAMVGGMEVFERFLVWKEGEELQFELAGATQEVWTRFAERYRVTETAPGKCRLVWTVAYEPLAQFARMQFLLKPVLGVTLRYYLWNLKRYCRRQAT